MNRVIPSSTCWTGPASGLLLAWAPVLLAQDGPPSNWLPSQGSYELTAEFGLGDEPILGVGGIAVTDDGRVLVFDASDAHVDVLGDDLSLIGRFGRFGRGPGELGARADLRYRPPPKHLISSRDGVVLLYDGVNTNLFTDQGTFRGYVNGAGPGSVAQHTLVGVQLLGSRALVVTDTRLAPRQLEVRLLSLAPDDAPSGPVLQIPLLPLPPRGEGPQHPRPFAIGTGDLILASDGSSNYLIRYRISNHATDSILLPALGDPRGDIPDVPVIGADGRRIPIAASPAPWRWQYGLIDPDGMVWIVPRVSRSQRGDLRPVVILDPRSGDHRMGLVPAMPRAFGPPGVFYSVGAIPETGEQVVRRYQSR